MGYNTTVVVLNDALDQIENDPDFGKKLAQAIRRAGVHISKHIDIPAGCHVNAAHVVETHHADTTAIIAVGGNLGRQIGSIYDWTFSSEQDLKIRAAKVLLNETQDATKENP